MRSRWVGICFLAAVCITQKLAAAELMICYNYSCANQAKIVLEKNHLDQIKLLFMKVSLPTEERDAIAKAIGLFVTFAGQQTPIWRDKGGNYNDDEVDGRMDCIDHSTNTTAYLKLLEQHNWLKFHKVLDIVSRSRVILDYHRSARIVEAVNKQEYAVDSWFLDHGQPAVIFTLEKWSSGAYPNE